MFPNVVASLAASSNTAPVVARRPSTKHPPQSPLCGHWRIWRPIVLWTPSMNCYASSVVSLSSRVQPNSGDNAMSLLI